MIKKINVFILAFILTCFSLQIVYGITMAAFSEKNHETVARGETAQFFIYFWNPEDEPSPIRLRVTQAPEDLVLIITPSDFMLNSSLVTEFPAEKGRHYINTQYGLMKTTPVRILVKVPKTMEVGNYDIVVRTTTGNPSGGVTTLLEKKFEFTVDVVIPSFFESTTIEGITTTQPKVNENISQIITGMATAVQLTDFILLIISIIVLAFVIWFIRFR